jgi:hypothetical protein
MNQAFNAYAHRLSIEHGSKFAPDNLAPTFAECFGQRVEVRFDTGETKRGWIGGTGGWRPSLMLLLRRHSRGSCWLVSEKDSLVRVLDRGPR